MSAYIRLLSELTYGLSLVESVCVVIDTATCASLLIETGKEYQEENSKVSFKSICLSSIQFLYFYDYSFPGGSVIKNLPANARAIGDVGSIPVSGRPPGGGKGNSLQYSCL